MKRSAFSNSHDFYIFTFRVYLINKQESTEGDSQSPPVVHCLHTNRQYNHTSFRNLHSLEAIVSKRETAFFQIR
mgnify:CR=1 FL=1